MRILFVFPGLSQRLSVSAQVMNSIMAPVPLTFDILASLTPPDHTVDYVDDHVQPIPYESNYDLVGITVYTRSANRAYQIADEFTKRKITVVLGGWHASALPQEAKQHADAVVIGEAEETWPQLLKDFTQGSLKPFYQAERVVDLMTLPRTRPLSSKRRLSLGFIQASRGCPYGCEFCSLTNSRFGNIHRVRPVDHVVQELRHMPQTFLSFNDNSLTVNVAYTKQLFRAMKQLNKKFYCNGNVDQLRKDDELLRLAREAGCIMWHIGFESISQEAINEIGKRTNKVGDYIEAVKKIHDHGMVVSGNFMFGFDADTPDIFASTLEVVRRIDLDVCAAAVITPLPGTPFFKRLEQQNRILSTDWSRYDLHTTVFQPKHMSPAELDEGTQQVNRDILSFSFNSRSILRSLPHGLPATFSTWQRNWALKHIPGW